VGLKEEWEEKNYRRAGGKKGRNSYLKA